MCEEKKSLPKIFPHAEVDWEVVKGFEKLLPTYSISCVVADAQERSGVMHSQIKLIDRSKKFVGPALTVKLYPGDLVLVLPQNIVNKEVLKKPNLRFRQKKGDLQ